MADVYFKEGTQSQYNNITPDEYTFYKVTNTENGNDVYLGTTKLSGDFDQIKSYTIATDPVYYAREELPTPNKTSITIHANTAVNIDGTGYFSTSDVSLSTSGIAEAGKDVYIYACAPSDSTTTPTFVLSQNSTVPSGYNENNSRKIGGFHCLCTDVGTISGHDLSGYKAGEILPASVWDLKHRPVSDPEGMVYDEGTGRWYDIYLSSWDGSKLVSEYNGSFVTGTSSNPHHGLKFKEDMGKIGKRLLWRHEFMCVAKGSNECTNITGSANPGKAGGHVDTANRRMISNIGLEDCCGCLWQWVNDEYEHFIYASTNSQAGTVSTSTGMISRYYTGNNDTSDKYFSGYIWATGDTALGATTSPANYNDTIDDNQMGDTYGLPRQASVGARYSAGSCCGSRALVACYFGSCANSTYGGRGASEPRVA